MFVIVELDPYKLPDPLTPALNLAGTDIRPHMRAQYLRQFKLYLAFVISRDLRICDSSACIMSFLEFLTSNGMSFRVVNNYVSALKFAFGM